MNRTLFRGAGRSAIASAVSRIVPTPEPSSLMPGPSNTESRCPPTTTVRSARPPGVSAITFAVCTSCWTMPWTLTVTVTPPGAWEACTSSKPVA